MQYLLPCGACGEKHVIEPRQAGRKISCGCGAVLEVPSLRGIRELAHTEPTKKRRGGPTWSPARGIIFVVGMLVAVIGLLVAGYALLVWRNLDTSEPLPEDLIAVYAAIDQRTPEEVLLLWQEEVRNRGIGTYHVPAYVVARDIARFFGMLAIGGACLAVIGAAASASSILLRKT
ncbi:MAG: hypothetical protein NTY19_48045 [Planctomycetota bacterium]|nr:hypothetical protein [Planctomycetota bacterium]